jgi:hypothetical protein
MYLVSGGGGARPYFVERTPGDLYKSALFPNYHFVKLTLEADRLHGEMYRVSNPEGESLAVPATLWSCSTMLVLSLPLANSKTVSRGRFRNFAYGRSFDSSFRLSCSHRV